MSALWTGRRVLMCVGTGGVGKTTTSAAIALAASASGLRTLVMTIDPARRLANAMGLEEFGNIEREISRELVASTGVELAAPLWAMMPDTKRTFDEMVERLSPDPQRRDAIFANRFYQQFSSALAGSLEYAAVEKLYEVYTSDRYDLIVLDTPPSQNATDFLEAPGTILDFFGHEALKLILKPYAVAGNLSLKLLDLGGSVVLSTLGRLAGADTIRELAEFILGFQGMYEGFRERSQQVRELLTSDELGFIVVSSPTPHQPGAVRALRDSLRAEDMAIRGLVLNRVRTDPLAGSDRAGVESALAGHLEGDVLAAVTRALDEEVQLAQLGGQRIAAMRDLVGDSPVVELPELPLDAKDLASLAALHGAFLDHA